MAGFPIHDRPLFRKPLRILGRGRGRSYFGDAEVELYAFLRWKLEETSLALGIQLHRVEHVRQAVFKAIVQDVADRTGCPAVFGKSEN